MTGQFGFEIDVGGSPAEPRRGRFRTPHGSFETPAFAPCGTQATIKGLFPETVAASGTELILSNTYHLALRPGSELVREAGGLHSFMGWSGPLLTDSGGFQVFSLSGMRHISDEGVRFAGPDSGGALELDPRRALEIQRDLGSDIAMVLDECPSADAPEQKIREAHRRTLLWADQARRVHAEWGDAGRGQAVFCILQGGRFPELRREAAEHLVPLDFDGYAIGGVSVGEKKELMYATVAETTPHLPPEKIHYLMGVGKPDDLFEFVLRGIDMFDCVTPTRHGRNNEVFVPEGVLRMRNNQHKRSFVPIQADCDCPTCTQFTRAYVRHLAVAKEMLAGILMSVHNLWFLQRLMRNLRERIAERHPESQLREWFRESHPGWSDAGSGGA